LEPQREADNERVASAVAADRRTSAAAIERRLLSLVVRLRDGDLVPP
jgi:hypothetical protein